MKYFRLVLLLLFPVCAFAQQQSPQDEEKKMYEMIEKEVERYEKTLELSGWQVFYVDSILTHDYNAMKEELMTLSKAKVSSSDVYVQVQDKWMEKIYVAFGKVFNEEQWAKYLKQGGAKEKKARDKREAKRNKQK